MKSKNHSWQQFVYPKEPMNSHEQHLEPEIDDFIEEVRHFLFSDLIPPGC